MFNCLNCFISYLIVFIVIFYLSCCFMFLLSHLLCYLSYFIVMLLLFSYFYFYLSYYFCLFIFRVLSLFLLFIGLGAYSLSVKKLGSKWLKMRPKTGAQRLSYKPNSRQEVNRAQRAPFQPSYTANGSQEADHEQAGP